MRVLVVGADAITRNIIEIVVRNAGHAVTCRESAEPALAVLADEAAGAAPFGVVFVDADLAHDGARRLCEASMSPDAPWIVAVAGQEEQGAQLLVDGAIEVLGKPIHRSALLECLERLSPYVERGRGQTTEIRACLAPTHASLVGTVLDGKYAIEELLGVGGMGAVYRARHVLMGQEVALKTIREDLAERETNRARFLREARTNMRLCHPNVIAVRDCGVTPAGALYMAQDYSRGVTLRAILADERRLAEGRVLSIARQCAAALQAAHEVGVVHRDLKPENILIEPGDRVRVCDFGLAKLFAHDDGAITADGVVVGTPHYMSPEQCEGRELDGRADLYALGCLVFECLTGEYLFAAASNSALFERQLFEAPRAPSALGALVSPRLDALVLRLLAKEPEDRPGSAAEVLLLLDELERARPAAPSRLLVADDSAASRALLTGLLTRWGHTVTAVADGASAVVQATAAGARFDCILLDGTMPVVDGLEAAVAIRRAEGSRQRVPIVLLSSSRSPEHLERCGAAGIDERLGKPVRPDLLQAALTRLLARDARLDRDDALDLEGALARVDGDRALLREALSLFVVDCERIERQLLAAHRRRDRAALARAAHELRGVSASCGAIAVAQRAEDLEEAAAHDSGSLPPLSAVRRALSIARAAIVRSAALDAA